MKGISYMKVYEMFDNDQGLSVGCLLYYEKERSFIIELDDALDEWSAPLIFSNMVKEGRFTASREQSALWVKERIVPNDRQNIDSILVNAKLHEYDEFALLVQSRGASSQDYIRVRELPEPFDYVKERMKHNISECVTCQDNSLLLFFNDETVRKVQIDECLSCSGVDKVIANEDLFMSGHVAAGGYCVTFNDSIDIPAIYLYEKGVGVPLTMENFISFVKMNIVDSSGACELLECSRQNLQYLTAKEHITPIKTNMKGNLYLKGRLITSRR
ncbi:MAG: hypothetical protein KBS56_00075 [Clostridiales bacterium]|nr:hypothetical protein [Candidatus Crickella equi]